MNGVAKKVCFFIVVFLVVLASGFCAGYFWNQSRTDEELDRAQKLVSEATATSLSAAKQLESSARLIVEIRNNNIQLERENKTIRDAIRSGLDRAAEIDDAVERSLEIVGIIAKLLDITGLD